MTANRSITGRLAWIAAAAALLIGASAGQRGLHAQQAVDQNGPIPDFSSHNMTWVLMNGTAYFKVPGDAGLGPIMQAGREYKHDEVPRIADTSNPILQPGPRN
jgi:hypothetical protein